MALIREHGRMPPQATQVLSAAIAGSGRYGVDAGPSHLPGHADPSDVGIEHLKHWHELAARRRLAGGAARGPESLGVSADHPGSRAMEPSNNSATMRP
jgi:hypothetical protein